MCRLACIKIQVKARFHWMWTYFTMDCSFPRRLILLTQCHVPSLFVGIWSKVRVWIRVSSWFIWFYDSTVQYCLSSWQSVIHSAGVNMWEWCEHHASICPDMSRQVAAWPQPWRTEVPWRPCHDRSWRRWGPWHPVRAYLHRTLQRRSVAIHMNRQTEYITVYQ